MSPRTALAFLAATTVLGVSSVASAQEYLFGGEAQIANGVVGGTDASPMRARTRLRLGADLRIDEFPKDIFAVGALIELEPRAAFGVDLRYLFEVGTHWVLNVGCVGFLAPETLIGPAVGVDYRIPFSHVSLVVGPEINAFVLGSDLPDGTIVWQALLQVGIHASL
jgi:hypothetical protein